MKESPISGNICLVDDVINDKDNEEDDEDAVDNDEVDKVGEELDLKNQDNKDVILFVFI